MFLRKLYSEPEDLFEEIEFVDGVNFIFGKKDNIGDKKRSMNGIGKSTLLDLIDFCLLASFSKDHSSRLYSAKEKELLTGYYIVLNFEIDKKLFVIKRSFDKPNEVLFGHDGKLETYTCNDLKLVLCDLIFKNEGYTGTYSDRWLRPLLLFFLKIQKHRREKFLDPVKYIKDASVSELNQYHFFLMGIDNTLLTQNYNIQENLKQKIPALREVKRLVEETYMVKDIADSRNEIDKINREIEKLELAIKQFHLADQYKDAETEANLITGEIKDVWYQNYSDRRKVNTYKESYELDTSLTASDIRKIESLYKELSTLLAGNIKKTLDQAINYRQQLAFSRKEFIAGEIKNLEDQILNRETSIEDLSRRRAELFGFLETREAIKDLTEAFYALSGKKKVVSDLEAKLKTYDTFELEKLDLQKEEKALEIEIKKFISEIQKSQVPEISKIFLEIYNAIYPQSKDPLFSINDKLDTDAKVEIRIEFPAMYSKGKNQGRILVYDLAVLFHAIQKKINCPRFLIHDGIFDGIDKAHLVHLYEFLETKKTSIRFQYIITLNEEGTLNESFGAADKVNPERIVEEAIKVLSPSKKLFKVEF